MLEIVKSMNSFLWSFLLIVALCATGLYYTIRLRFIQFTGFKEGLKTAFGMGQDRNGHKGAMSSFQSLATAVAAQVGTGNLVGAATAIVSGGPGAIFWMWISAFLGMATAYAEATLAQKYRTERDGEIVGGPAYYIRAAFKGKFGKILAGIFAVSVIIALGFIGNMVQSNSISSAFANVFETRNMHVAPLIIGIIVAAFAGLVFVGGVKRLARVTEWLVPVMAIIYVIGTLIVIGINYKNIPDAFRQIFVGAFNPQAVVGGALGIGVREAIRYGVARGLFSNEAGMGSTPHAHALAVVKTPHQQGSVAMISVFIDTFVILNLTVFTLLTTGAINGKGDGIKLTQNAFVNTVGNGGDIFIAICLFFFAFSTILGWHFFGSVNIKYLFGKKAMIFYSLIVVAFIILGSTMKVALVWELADFFNGIMVLPNLIALLALNKVIVQSHRENHLEVRREKKKQKSKK